MPLFNTLGKSTVNFRFVGSIPRRFEIYDSRGNLYFFRYLDETKRDINVNIAHAGTYTTNGNAYITVKNFQEPALNFDLPEREKSYFRGKFNYRYNPDLKGTPARHFFKKGLIEIGPLFYVLPFPVRVFILCHEIGHCFYSDEKKADMFACFLFLKNGYNKTTAIHSLMDVLNLRSSANVERVNHINKILK